LETEYEDPRFAENIPGLYFIATFYISAPLQGTGLGRAAMDAVETMATSEPLCAKTLALSTATSDCSTEEKWDALGRNPPKVCLMIN
jgi:GNAT superfamily N-acetyltransferase